MLFFERESMASNTISIPKAIVRHSDRKITVYLELKFNSQYHLSTIHLLYVSLMKKNSLDMSNLKHYMCDTNIKYHHRPHYLNNQDKPS